HLGAAAVGVEQNHRGAVGGAAVRDQSVGADSGMTRAQLARSAIQMDARDILLRQIQKVVAVGMGFCETGHLRQNARRCQPNRATSALGSRLTVPTKTPL